MKKRNANYTCADPDTHTDHKNFPPERLFFSSDKQSLVDAIGWDSEKSGICPSNPFEDSLRSFDLACFWGFLEVSASSLFSCSLSLPPCKARVLYVSSRWVISNT